MLEDRGVVKGAQQSTPALKLFEKTFIVNTEAECPRSCVKICAINKDGNPLLELGHYISLGMGSMRPNQAGVILRSISQQLYPHCAFGERSPSANWLCPDPNITIHYYWSFLPVVA